MSPIKYELYEVEDKTLLNVIKNNMEIFHMLGFTTFEQGCNLKIGNISNEGILKTSLKKTNNNKKLSFTIENDLKKIKLTSNLETVGKNTEFVVYQNGIEIFINKFFNPITSSLGLFISKKNSDNTKKSTIHINSNNISVYQENNNVEKSLYYTDLSMTSLHQTPNLIASYFDSSSKVNNSYHRVIQICRHQEEKGYYLETNHNYNGLRVFQDKSISLNNRKDASSYALELLETKEVQDLFYEILKDFSVDLIDFISYIKKYSIANNFFQQQIDSEIYRLYCGVQKRIHEIANPIRIEQLLEEMNFEKQKIKTLKNKA